MSTARTNGLIIMLYGPGGTGKTASIKMDNAALIGQAPDQQAISIQSWGIKGPGLHKAAGIKEATDLMLALAPKHRVIAIDDIHYLVQSTLNSVSNWKVFQPILDRFYEAMEGLAGQGKIIILTSHERDARADTSKGYQRGGPNLPGTIPEAMCGKCSVVLRTVYSEEAEALTGFPVVVWSRVRKQWFCRDRTNTFVDNTPLDLVEGLRLAGYAIHYPPEMEWAVEMIDKWAKYIVEKPEESREEAIQTVKEKTTAMWRASEGPFKDHRSKAHMEWVKQASVNRALIMLARDG